MKRYVMLVFVSVVIVLAGCGDKTKGYSSGRVDLAQTTSAERNSGKILIGDLAAASSKIAEEFVMQLNRIAEEEWSGYRVTLIVGDIANKTSGRARISTTEFEYVRDRILSQLTKNKTFRDNVKVTRKSSRIEQLKTREKMNSGNLLDDDSNANAIDRGNDKYVYFLNADMYTINRGTTSLYNLKFTVDSAHDGAIVFSENYEVKYQ
jgi:uncharacterized lipoprotein YehR (DUF1307 family)